MAAAMAMAMAAAGSIAMAGAELATLRCHAAVLACSLLVAGLSLSLPVQAQGRHHHYHHGGPRVHFGFVVGAPLYPYWYAPPPRHYYPAPVVAVPAAPPIYIEQTPPLAQSPYPAHVPPALSGDDAGAWWYFCRESGIYYPYVKSCAGGWQRVAPQTPRG